MRCRLKCRIQKTPVCRAFPTGEADAGTRTPDPIITSYAMRAREGAWLSEICSRDPLCVPRVCHLVGDVAVDHAGLAEAFRSERATLDDLEHAGDPDSKSASASLAPGIAIQDDAGDRWHDLAHRATKRAAALNGTRSVPANR